MAEGKLWSNLTPEMRAFFEAGKPPKEKPMTETHEREAPVCEALTELTKDEHDELIDILRKNFLYQQPWTAWPKDEPEPEAKDPVFVLLKMLPGHWQQMMGLIHKAGGWVMPDEVIQEAMRLSGEVPIPEEQVQ